MIKHDTMEQYVADRTPALAAPVVHIHQGGTLNTYCGAPLTLGTNVSWEDRWEKATCDDCHCGFAAS